MATDNSKLSYTNTVHVSFLVSFFINVILPVLPALILQSFPQIQANAKLMKVLKQVDDVLDQVIGD